MWLARKWEQTQPCGSSATREKYFSKSCKSNMRWFHSQNKNQHKSEKLKGKGGYVNELRAIDADDMQWMESLALTFTFEARIVIVSWKSLWL